MNDPDKSVTTPELVHRPPGLAFGVSSFVLGMIGFPLFFLPILGAPISACDGSLVAGLAGCPGRRCRFEPRSLQLVGWRSRAFVPWRHSGINVAVAYAPRYATPPTGPPSVSVPDTPYVPPPALE